MNRTPTSPRREVSWNGQASGCFLSVSQEKEIIAGFIQTKYSLAPRSGALVGLAFQSIYPYTYSGATSVIDAVSFVDRPYLNQDVPIIRTKKTALKVVLVLKLKSAKVIAIFKAGKVTHHKLHNQGSKSFC